MKKGKNENGSEADNEQETENGKRKKMKAMRMRTEREDWVKWTDSDSCEGGKDREDWRERMLEKESRKRSNKS